MDIARRNLLTGAATFPLAPRAMAQEGFSSRPVTLVVPAAPGGSTDILARIVARPMSVLLGVPVVVENVGGAGGTIGTRRGAGAAPDGHTLVVGNNGTMAANLSLYRELGFDSRTFTPIGVIATVPMVLAVGPRMEARTLPAFLNLLRAQGERVTFGTPGVGAMAHLAPAYLLHLTGLRGTLVAYRGVGPAMSDLANGTVNAILDQTVTMIPAHRGGTAVAIAVTGPTRLPGLADVPTFAEAGLPAFDLQVWNAICAPPGMRAAARDRLAGALDAALDDTEAKRRFDELYAAPPAQERRGPGPLASLIREEAATWAEVIQATGMRAE